MAKRMTKFSGDFNAPARPPNDETSAEMKAAQILDAGLSKAIAQSTHTFNGENEDGLEIGIFSEVGYVLDRLEEGLISSEEQFIEEIFRSITSSFLRLVEESGLFEASESIFYSMFENNPLGVAGLTLLINASGNHLLNRLGLLGINFAFVSGNVKPLDSLMDDSGYYVSYASNGGGLKTTGLHREYPGYVRCAGMKMAQAFMSAFRNTCDTRDLAIYKLSVDKLLLMGEMRRGILKNEYRRGVYDINHFLGSAIRTLSGESKI